MARLRMTENGFTSFTGEMGMIEWLNGESVEDVPQRIADRISGMIRVESIDTGKQVGAQVRAETMLRVDALVDPGMKRATEKELEEERARDAINEGNVPVETFYSLDELQSMADLTGLRGLREVGDKWGVKGREIGDLIKKILTAQSEFKEKQAKPVRVVADTAPVVETAETLDVGTRVFVDGVLVDPHREMNEGGDEIDAPAPVDTASEDSAGATEDEAQSTEGSDEQPAVDTDAAGTEGASTSDSED